MKASVDSRNLVMNAFNLTALITRKSHGLHNQQNSRTYIEDLKHTERNGRVNHEDSQLQHEQNKAQQSGSSSTKLYFTNLSLASDRL